MLFRKLKEAPSSAGGLLACGHSHSEKQKPQTTGGGIGEVIAWIEIVRRPEAALSRGV